MGRIDAVPSGRRRAARMAYGARRSWTAAVTRGRPPQRGQARIWRSNARRIMVGDNGVEEQALRAAALMRATGMVHARR